MPFSPIQTQNCHHSSRSVKSLRSNLTAECPARASSEPWPLCPLRALAITAVSIFRLVIFWLISSALSEPRPGSAKPSSSSAQLRHLRALAISTVSEPWSLVSSVVSGPQTSSTVSELRGSSAVSQPWPASVIFEPFPAPLSPSPSKFRRLRAPANFAISEPRKSSTVSELWPAPPYSSPGPALYRLRALASSTIFKSFPARPSPALSSSTVSEPWQASPSPTPFQHRCL